MIRSFCVLAAAFFASTALGEEQRAAIFAEPGFVSSDPGLPGPEWFRGRLQGADLLDSGLLADPDILNVRNYSLLVLPYGEAFPAKSFENIFEFVRQGGGIMTVSGRPFARPIELREKAWQAWDGDVERSFFIPLGIRTYGRPGAWRVEFKTGSRAFSFRPSNGNVFPYRVPSRSSYRASELDPAFEGYDVVLVKNFRNPYSPEGLPAYRWCCITGERERNFLTHPETARLLFPFLERWLTYPCSIERVETAYACYGTREPVRYSVVIAGTGNGRRAYTLELFVLDGEERQVFHAKRRGFIPSGQSRVTVRGSWSGKRQAGFYRVRACLSDGSGARMDREENGFVVRDKGTAWGGRRLGINGGQFTLDARPALLVGVNYYESTRGELCWLRPDIARMRADFAAMKAAGMNYVRIHYAHSKWFRDYFSASGMIWDREFFSTADASPLPSERSLRLLDAVVALAQEQGLVLCLDLFSLVPREMGDPRGWLGMKERVYDFQKIAWQRKFARQLAERYRDVPGLTWDLWNEPRLKGEDRRALARWAKGLIAEFRNAGDTHPITIGDDDSTDLLDILDYACLHVRDIPPDRRVFGKPVMVQELWNEAGSCGEEEERQADELEKDFNDFLRSGYAGFAPWQWTGQARLWDEGAEERWDDELGTCVRADGSVKPAGTVYRCLIAAQAGAGRCEER